MALCVIVNAKSKNVTNSRHRPKGALASSIKVPNHLSPHHRSTFKTKIELVGNLLYNCTKKKIEQFTTDPANIFLLEFFAANGGLTLTNSRSNRPDCRSAVLYANISR